MILEAAGRLSSGVDDPHGWFHHRHGRAGLHLLGASLLTSVLFGALPALHARRVDLRLSHRYRKPLRGRRCLAAHGSG